MDFVKEWTMCVCITLVISVIVSMLAPSGNLSSFYRVLISLFIFMSLIYPFTNMDLKGFDYNIEIVDQSQDLVTNMVDSQIKNVLKSNNIVGAVVDSKISVLGDEITINNVDVYVSDEYDLNDVKDIIFRELSINSRVNYIGS